MPENPNYIPPTDAALAAWSDNFSAVLTAAPTDYGLVSGDAVAVAAVVDPWLIAYALVTSPTTKTKVTVAAKDAAKAAMLRVLRPYAVNIAGNPAVSDPDKVTIGVTVRITTRTRNAVGAIDAVPSHDTISNTQVEFRCVNPDTPTTDARPLGAICWQLELQTDTAQNPDPPDWRNLSTLSLTKKLYRLDVDGLPSTANYRYRARWLGRSLNGGAENTGPWSVWTEFSIPG